MLRLQTTGTGGDAFITALKLSTLDEHVQLNHTIEGEDHPYWHSMIARLLFMAPNVSRVEFKELDESLPRVTSYPDSSDDDIEIGTNYFPDWPILHRAPHEVKSIADDYVGDPIELWAVIACHSGKPHGKGRNTKRVRRTEVMRWVEDLAPNYRFQKNIGEWKIVLLGTDSHYEDLGEDDDRVLNLVGKTEVREAVALAHGADLFYGPEGLLAFSALSGNTPSEIFYTSREAVDRRIVGPWRACASCISKRKTNDDFLR